MDNYFLIAVLGQLLGGIVSAVGVIVGLRIALPSLARALVREIDRAREPADAAHPEGQAGRPVVTLHP